MFAFAAEHHANLLPWRRADVALLPVPASAADAVGLLETALSCRSPGRPRLVSVTGASNVTGEIWPYADLALVAYAHGARFMLDAAQLAPHRRLDMAGDGIDYLALSGHKLYAPFGAGALVGARDWLCAREPHLAGGGAVRYVGTDTVLWADLPDRQEAGSPNVVGAVALGVACRTLQVATESPSRRTRTGWSTAHATGSPRSQGCGCTGSGTPAIRGSASYRSPGVPYARLAAALSAEHGIGVRHGCFCAHPLMIALLRIDARHEAAIRDGLARGVPTAVPGAVRASAGLGTTAADLDRLVDAVTDIAAHGPWWTYTATADGTDCRPTPDPWRRPRLSFELATASSLAPSS